MKKWAPVIRTAVRSQQRNDCKSLQQHRGQADLPNELKTSVVSKKPPQKKLASNLAKQRDFDEIPRYKQSSSAATVELPPKLNSAGWNTSEGRSHHKTNEDRCISEQLTSDVEFFGVFDGHNGSYVSEFLKENLVKLIERHVIERKIGELSYETCERAFFQSFARCQELLRQALEKEVDMIKKDIVGSTAVVALLCEGRYLSTANVGDSKVVVCERGGYPLELSLEHHPGVVREAERIERRGGWIDWDSRFRPLVNGRLSITRSFGNLLLRRSGVISKPTVQHRDTRADCFAVLCSDGISHTVTDSELVSIVQQHSCAAEAAVDLTSTAQQYGSDDDCTVIVAPLAGWHDDLAPGGGCGGQTYSMFRTMVGSRSGG